MKILFLTNRLPYPLNDGGNIATFYNLKFLKERGHEVSLFSLNTNKHYENPENLTSVVHHIKTVDINTDLHKTEAVKSLFSTLPYNAHRFFSNKCAQQLKELLQNKTFDIIQLEGPYMFLYEKVLQKYSNAKIVYRAHNVEFKIWERQAANENNIFKRIYIKNLARKIKKFELNCLKNVDSIITISKDDEKQIRELAPNKPLTTISAGIDLSEYNFSENTKKENTLCFIGSLQWMPNLLGLNWFLDNIWQPTKVQNPQLEFHVAGKNPPEYLAKKQMNGYVFHGMVASQQDFLNAYDILVVPLLSGSGMRIKIIEALALKKCIISTEIGCEGIALNHQKNIIIANTPEEMVEAITFLVQNPQKKQAIAEAGYAFVKEHFDWASLILKFEKVYESLSKKD